MDLSSEVVVYVTHSEHVNVGGSNMDSLESASGLFGGATPAFQLHASLY